MGGDFCCAWCCLGVAQAGWGRNGAVEVRRVGLSKVGENTLLTVVLDRPAEPRISTGQRAGKPQLVVEFPQARAGRLPTRLAGDDLLVEQVLTEVFSRRRGEDRPGAVSRTSLTILAAEPSGRRPGRRLFILGLKPDTTATQAQGRRPPRRPRQTAGAPAGTRA